ncbi:MAG: sulfatase-like hydrolase/transferase [Bacteroidota bacterium]
MRMTISNIFIGLVLIAGFTVLPGCDHAREAHPNIVYILADDLGYGDVSCLNDDSGISTPNLDKLAAEGIIFTDSHSGSAVCTPTRYGILTGRYCWRSRLKSSVLWQWDVPLIEPDRLTVGDFLKQHGYTTACIGKWHLGWDWPTYDGSLLAERVDFSAEIRNGPVTRGFDYYFGDDVPNFPPYCFIENKRTLGIPSMSKPDSMFGAPGPMVEGWNLEEVMPALTRKAVEYIKAGAGEGLFQRDPKKPFFLYFPLTAPHTPIAPAPEFQGRSDAGAYGDYVQEVDWTVGQVMKALEEEGLAENTLVIFTSDNGSPGRDGTKMSGPTNSVRQYGHNPSHIFRGIKADIWEGGHHVPFFARWPGKITPGSESDEIICHTDLMRTLSAILDEPLPENSAEDSYNILPALLGESCDNPIREATVHHSGNGSFSIRQGKWKLVLCAGSGGWSKPHNQEALDMGLPEIQLYDLNADIKEENNLYDQYPEIVEELSALLHKYKDEGRSTNISEAADRAFQLSLVAPVDRWDEAIPLGNGLTGGLLWGEGSEIRLSLDRGDLWDLRPHPGFTAPGFSYETVRRMALAGQADSLNAQYARGNDYPTKLPGTRLVLTLPPGIEAQSFHLDMKRGLGTVRLDDKQIECFFSAEKPLALMKIPGSYAGLDLVANEAVVKLGNDPPQIDRDENGIWFVQDAAMDFRYVFYVRTRQFKDYTLLAISTATSGDSDDPLGLARAQAEKALKTGYDSLFKEHENWWSEFWSRSSVNLPHRGIQQQYNLVQYFYGAASKRGAPPIPLQGVWTADDGRLPPWHGDYHHDLNTQLTYWAYLTSNRFDQGFSFLDFMWSLKPVHEEFARNFFGTEGHVVPGVMALDGKPMGAWYQYTLSPTMGAWVAQSFYWHWRYTMDREFLGERAYPYCAGIAEALVGLMEPDENGLLKLTLSSSPEIHNNRQEAWLTPNSNNDLALIRWIFGANAEMAGVLGMEQEADRWKGLLARMDELAVEGEEGALLIAPGEALKESHRHHAHLMGIHPLGVIHVEGTGRDRMIIDASLRQIDELGTQLWNGYSFAWMACIRARAGQSGRALEYLENFVNSFTLPNGFHRNGESTQKGLSGSRSRAFTLEGNFAASQAVHEMLLQSWGGRIRIFPATPDKWKDVTFSRLRAEGGWIVSAEKKGGKTVHVEITSTVGQKLRLKDPFGNREFESNITMERSGDDELSCVLKKGQTLQLYCGSPSGS